MSPYTQGKSHAPVTKDPNPLNVHLQFSSILYTYLTVVHNLIAINPLRSPWTINSNLLSLGEVQKILKTDSRCTILLARSSVQTRESTGMTLKTSHLDLILSSEDEMGFKETPDTTQAQFDSHVYANPSSLVSPSGPICTLTLGQVQLFSPPSGRAQSPNHPNITKAYSEISCTPLPTQQHQSLIFNSSNNFSESHGHNTIPGNTILPAQTSQESSEMQHKQNKQRTLPTRRSQRILEKRTTFGSDQNTKKRTKTQASMIQFDKDSHQTPLDASKTLQILQTTGLMINKQIEDLIDEAVKQDQAMEDADHSTPTTPLHDPIPPLAIPGTNMLL